MRANSHTTTSHGTRTHRASPVPNAPPHGTQPTAPALSQPDHPAPDPRGIPLKDTLRSLAHQIRQLRTDRRDTLAQLLTLCHDLKEVEDQLRHAQQTPQVSDELDPLRQALPAFFKSLRDYLDRHADTPLDIDALQTLCLGLAALAPPIPGPLLHPEQCQDAQARLAPLSDQLAQQLTSRIEQQVTDPGPLLNCLNWFSRALKANMLSSRTPAIRHLFHNALTQLHNWAMTTHADSFTSHQLAKAMVQLNTMVNQQLISTDAHTADGSANRTQWSGCVQQLCRRFLASDYWLNQCNGIELINVTNTLKDGLEQGLLSVDDTDLKSAIQMIAPRIREEALFAGANTLPVLSNSANFLRCLFEHGLLGSLNSPTGQAANDLLNQIVKAAACQGLHGSHAQALVNLASYLKAVDRWLAGLPPAASQGAWKRLAQASSALVTTLQQLSASDPRWMRSPQSGGGLLSALQHLGQRGLLREVPAEVLAQLLQPLLDAIPHWQIRPRHSQSLVQSLRSLMALCQRPVAAMPLPDNAVVGRALRSLLTPLQEQLQQGQPLQIRGDEWLACLQAAQTGITLGALSIDEVQPLLQHLLRCATPVTLDRLEQVLRQTGAGEVIEALSAQVLSPTPTGAAAVPEKPAKVPGPTYRGDASQPKPVPAPVRSTLASPTDWLTPRHAAKPGALPLPGTTVSASPSISLSTSSSALLFARTPATQPTLVNRPAASNKTPASVDRPSAPKSAAPGSATPAASTAPAKNDQAGLTQTRAQKEWFTLLEQGDSKALPRLKELAADYPELLNQKSAGKKGPSALFYALLHGRKEIADWLIEHDQHRLPEDLGAFLRELLGQIEFIDRRHLATVRRLLEAAVKRHDQRTSDEHAQQQPSAPPLSRKALLERRTNMIKAEHKEPLSKFPPLQPLMEELKLNRENRSPRTTEKSNTGNLPVFAVPGIPDSGKLSLEQSIALLKNASYLNDTKKIATIFNAALDPDTLARMSNIDGTTLLMIAAEKGEVSTINAILGAVKDKDAIARVQDKEGMTSFQIAANSPNPQAAMLILNAVNNKDALASIPCIQGITTLMDAALTDNAELVASILHAVDNPDALAQAQDDFGNAALMRAAPKINVTTAMAILNAVNDKDTLLRMQNKEGTTALMIAAYSGNADLVKALLNATDNADALVQIQDGNGATALMFATSKGDSNTVLAILDAVTDKEALVKMQDLRGNTALIGAMRNCSVATVTTIINTVKDPDALAQMQNKNGMTALMYAVSTETSEKVMAIFNGIKDPETLVQIQARSGATALAIAVAQQKESSILAILNAVEGVQNFV